MAHVPSARKVDYEPFAVEGYHYSDADQAAAPALGALALAAKPRPVDDENMDDFCVRWADLLAKAYHGQLAHPRYLPLT